MKTKSIIPALSLALLATSASAQLKVTTASGKVKVGQEPPVGVVTDDPYNVLSMHIYGMNGDYRAGSKAAFGDFGRYNYWGWNVFVGEYRDYDSDQLWLHGKNGIYLTRGRGDDLIGYYDVAYGNKFTFNCDLYVYSTYIASDARFKTDVKKLDNPLDKLMKLDGVSYKLLPKVINGIHGNAADNTTVKQTVTTETGGTTSATAKGTTSNQNIGAPSAKELRSQAGCEAYNKKIEENQSTHLGFIAQDLKKVFPDLVKQDSSNYMYVDYIGLIPVIVEAMKEQQKQIEAKDEQIKQMENRMMAMEDIVNSCCSKSSSNANGGGAETGSSLLYQNEPNPFNAKTDIRYFLNETAQASVINIYDIQGTMIKSFNLEGHGQGSVTLNGSELKPGIYVYSLIVNGKQVDSKRMSLVK